MFLLFLLVFKIQFLFLLLNERFVLFDQLWYVQSVVKKGCYFLVDLFSAIGVVVPKLSLDYPSTIFILLSAFYPPE